MDNRKGRAIRQDGVMSIVPFAEDINEEIPCKFITKQPKNLDKTRKVVICTVCNIRLSYNALDNHRKSIKHKMNTKQVEISSKTSEQEVNLADKS